MTTTENFPGPTLLMKFQFPARAEYLRSLREKIRESLGAANFGENTIQCAVLALGEACMNVIQHAYSSDESGEIVVEVERREHCLLFRITDFAARKSSQQEMKSRPLNEIRPGGLGCHIINEIMDEVQLIECPRQCGNILELKKNLDSEAAPNQEHCNSSNDAT